MSVFVHPSAIVDEGCHIGAGTRIWHFSHLMTGCSLGEGCSIGQNVFIAGGVHLGRNVKVQNNVSIYEGVVCEDDVFLGPSVVFTNIKNPRSAISRKDQYVPTLVRKGATIGANATIVCGNEIGAFALIGAGAVVTKPVKPYALVKGNPGRQSGWVSEYGHTLSFDEHGLAVCRESGQQYRLADNKITRLT
ncbi:MAG TPA: acyltransferase [Flavisolibacter sp.]|nr:acyltransferase [Flavisolibacter sp.]